jgi:hypothetical protein
MVHRPGAAGGAAPAAAAAFGLCSRRVLVGNAVRGVQSALGVKIAMVAFTR